MIIEHKKNPMGTFYQTRPYLLRAQGNRLAFLLLLSVMAE